MKTEQLTLYTIDELSADVQERVIEKYRENNEYDFLEEDLRERLDIKLENSEIKTISGLSLRYSLGCCQGDGLSFTGVFEYKDFTFRITENYSYGSYCHKYSININIDYEEVGDLADDVARVTEKKFREIILNICDELEKEGYAYIEEEDNEENVKQHFRDIANYFLESGEIWE